MSDLLTMIPVAGLGGAFTWAGQLVVSYFKSRDEREKHQHDTDATLKGQTDKLTFDLLRAAREEVAAARIEAGELGTLRLRLVHFDEALDHIEMLLNATTPEDKAAADRRARQFLVRMKRFSEGAGAMRNEAQVALSREDIASVEALKRNLP